MNLWDVLEGGGNALDLPASVVRDILAWENPADQFLTPFSDENRTSGRGMLEKWGALDENQEGLDWGDAAGFGVELLTDPMNIFGLAKMGRTALQARHAKTFNRAADAMKAAGAMPWELAERTVARDPLDKPVKLFHGTSHVFDEVDVDKTDPMNLFGKGFYMTADPKLAGTYTGKNKSKWWTDKLTEAVQQEFPNDPDLVARLTNPARGLTESDGDILFRLRNAIGNPPQNVRMHHLYAENPFRPDDPMSIPELKTLMGNLQTLPDRFPGDMGLNGAWGPHAQEEAERVAGIAKAFNKFLDSGQPLYQMSGTLPDSYTIKKTLALTAAGHNTPAESMQELIDDLSPYFPSRDTFGPVWGSDRLSDDVIDVIDDVVTNVQTGEWTIEEGYEKLINSARQLGGDIGEKTYNPAFDEVERAQIAEALGHFTPDGPRDGSRLFQERSIPGTAFWDFLEDQTDLNESHKVLQHLGFDSINHQGGIRAGGGKRLHDVWIALDGKNVYNPYVVPKKVDVPRISPMIPAGLGTHNLLRLLDQPEFQ